MRFGVRFPGRQLLRDQSPELAPHLADSGKTPDLISHARQSDNSRNPNPVRQTGGRRQPCGKAAIARLCFLYVFAQKKAFE